MAGAAAGVACRAASLLIVSDRWGGFFGPLRNLTGVQKLCTLFYDDPAFVEEMMDANADFVIAVLGQILDVTPIDAFFMWEDMGYNHAPLISPAMAREIYAASLPPRRGFRPLHAGSSISAWTAMGRSTC